MSLVERQVRTKYASKMITLNMTEREDGKLNKIMVDGPLSGQEKRDFYKICSVINDLLDKDIRDTHTHMVKLDNIGFVDPHMLNYVKDLVGRYLNIQ